jgi:hypothetical protein
MYKTFAGLAAAAVLTVVAVPTAPASAAPIRHAPGIEHQSSVETVQYRRYRRNYYRGPVVRRGYYGRGYYAASPYPYVAPYPYYRPYYQPRPYVGIGPFGFGVF